MQYEDTPKKSEPKRMSMAQYTFTVLVVLTILGFIIAKQLDNYKKGGQSGNTRISAPEPDQHANPDRPR